MGHPMCKTLVTPQVTPYHGIKTPQRDETQWSSNNAGRDDPPVTGSSKAMGHRMYKTLATPQVTPRQRL